jgi:hypothetical protein
MANIKTSDVAGSAYTAKQLDTGCFLTHAYDMKTGKPLCKRVKAEHLLCDPGSTDEDAPATCPHCAKKDPRFLTHERMSELFNR